MTSLDSLRRGAGVASAQMQLERPEPDRRAAADARSDPWPVSSTYQLPASTSSAALARRLLRGALTAWPSELVNSAELLVSELVTNAVQHGRSAPVVRVDAYGSTLRVTVADDCPSAPGVRHPDADADSGRGLLLVETVATSWGWSQHARGKLVWFTI